MIAFSKERASPKWLPHPPGPTNYGRFMGITYRHLFRMMVNPLDFASRVGHKFGDVSSFLFLTKRIYIVNHPDLLHELLVSRRDDYKRATWQTRILRQVLGDGLLMSDGDLWHRQRRLIQQSFRATTMSRQADQAVDVTLEHLNKWSRDANLDLVSRMAELSTAISIKGTVGLHADRHGMPTADDLSQTIIHGASILMKDMENPFSPPDWAPLESRRAKRKALDTINAYVRHAIAVRRDCPNQHDDILATLLTAVDKDGDGGGMTDELAHHEAVNMLLAGNHASSATLGWFWKLVLARPEVHAKLVEEVDSVLADRRATLEDLPKLTYTKQVLQETLRLYPAAWVLFAREAVRETSLGGYRVRRGGWVFAYPFVTHRDPQFFENPLEFDPERFSTARIDEFHAGAYFPFGHGARSCVGKHLAMMQLTLIVATVLQKLELTSTPGCSNLTIDRDLSIRPATPCTVATRKRQD